MAVKRDNPVKMPKPFPIGTTTFDGRTPHRKPSTKQTNKPKR
jgi:hypothetical protein